MFLFVLYTDGSKEKFNVRVVWQDHVLGMDKVYYETFHDEIGKGKFISTKIIKTWQITS